MGIAAGRGMINMYLEYFKFPFLIFQLDPASFVTGFLVSVGAASAGGLLVLRRVFALTRHRPCARPPRRTIVERDVSAGCLIPSSTSPAGWYCAG